MQVLFLILSVKAINSLGNLICRDRYLTPALSRKIRKPAEKAAAHLHIHFIIFGFHVFPQFNLLFKILLCMERISMIDDTVVMIVR